jgi:hypothetical protein
MLLSRYLFLNLKFNLIKVQMRDNHRFRAVTSCSCGNLSKVKGVVVFLITNIVSVHDGLSVASQVGAPVKGGVGGTGTVNDRGAESR